MDESMNVLLSSSFSDPRKGLLLCGREENSWETKEERGIVRPMERHSYATTRSQARVQAVYLYTYRRDNTSKTLFHVRILGAVPLRAGTSSCNAQHPRVARCIRRALCSNIIFAPAFPPSAFLCRVPALAVRNSCRKFQRFAISLLWKNAKSAF